MICNYSEVFELICNVFPINCQKLMGEDTQKIYSYCNSI